MLAQHPPNLIVGDFLQRRGQQGSVPTRITFGRRLIQLREDATLAVAAVDRRLAWPRRILQTVHPVAQKAAAPLARRSRPRVHGRSDLLIAGPGGCPQNHAGPKHIPRPLLGRRTTNSRSACSSGVSAILRAFMDCTIHQSLIYATRY